MAAMMLDYRGNFIQPGDTVLLVKVRQGSSYPMALIFHKPFSNKLQWRVVDEYEAVWFNAEVRLRYVRGSVMYLVSHSSNIMMSHILCIKGVSDSEQDFIARMN